WYGVDLNNIPADLGLVSPPKSHVSDALAGLASVQVPVRMDPGFDDRRTTNLGRMVEQWGLVPFAYLAQFANSDFTYGYVGNQDFTMYPILPPGSFIQVDEAKNKIVEGSWRSEYERPIYFVETREGHTCCWCSMRREDVILQPHPLSPVPIRILKHPQRSTQDSGNNFRMSSPQGPLGGFVAVDRSHAPMFVTPMPPAQRRQITQFAQKA